MGSACCTGRSLISDGIFQDDVDEFDRAYEANDIPAFIKLCQSNCEIEKIDQKMHPWAAEPETIGALATTQIAILSCRKTQPEYKDIIRESGGIEVLVKLIDKGQMDKCHASVVALSFLSVDNPQNCLAMYDAGAISRLISVMKLEPEGVRAAAAQTARNIYILDPLYRKEFVRLGGLLQLLKLLQRYIHESSVIQSDFRDGNSSDWALLEILYHIEDLILDNGTEISELLRAAQNAGTSDVLEKLRDSENPDISEAASLLLIRLSD